MSKRVFWIPAILVAVMLAAPMADGATEAEKQAAIDAGLEYLAKQQQATGYWNQGDSYEDIGATGSAILAFLEEGYKAGTDVVFGATNYGDVVGKGIDFLLGNAQVVTIGNTPDGDNPDGDGNGIGVKFNTTASSHSRDTYLTGIVLPAIASSGTPNKLVTTGALASRTDGSGAAGAWTYKDVVQNSVDYFAHGQVDSGYGEGGWRYWANYTSADNSTTQWPVVAMLFAKNKMGVDTPQFVKDELRQWVDYIQNSDGGSYYDNNFNYWQSNMSRTGAWLLEADFIGADATDVTAAEIAAAQSWVDSNWNTGTSGTGIRITPWDGNFGHPYAMWSTYKGLEATIGLDAGTGVITPRAQGTAVIDNPNHGWNWYEDYCEYIVNMQKANGDWDGYSYWDDYLATSWYINILQSIQVSGPVVPLPSAAWLGFALLGGLGLFRRIRRRKI